MLPFYYLFQALGDWTSRRVDLTIDALPWYPWNLNYLTSRRLANTKLLPRQIFAKPAIFTHPLLRWTFQSGTTMA